MGNDPGWSSVASGWDVPDAYVARDRRRALAAGLDLPDRVQGAALFADVSGFTPLAAALSAELGAERGPEELTACLNRVFHAVIERLDAFGGEVIYFSGDAITCWLDGDDGSRAVACALAMQEVMEDVGAMTTPGGSEERLAMKVAIAVGPARRFVVGDPALQLLDVLAGRLVDDLAAAEQHARRGEVVLDESALEALGDGVVLGERRRDPGSGREVAVVTGLRSALEEGPVDEVDPLPEDLVRPWLLPAVYERMRTGRGEFLAELRPAVPLFLRFGGIDFDEDDRAAARLDAFTRRAQRVLADHGGNLLQLVLGDKGASLYAVFGSPHSHEDDAVRAVAAAIELRALDGLTAARDLCIGITRGRLRSGTYGHAMRRTFVCLGDAVNLAARLMSAAPPGAIYVEQAVHDAAGEAFVWESLAPFAVKGREGLVHAYDVMGVAGRLSRRVRHEGPLVGRSDELTTLEASLGQALERGGRIVGLAGEAGMGKSRLLAELVRRSDERGVRVLVGECASFGVNTSYLAWRGVWRDLFDLDPDDVHDRDAERVHEALAAIDPALLPRAPLLAVPLGLELPDTELTASFDAKLRKTSLEDLLVTFLRARAAVKPLLVVLEDCHWLDPLSRDLLEAVGRQLSGLPVLVVLAYRPEAGARTGLGLASLPGATEVPLTALEDAEMAVLIEARLGGAPGSDGLRDLVTARAQGNPFYAEELLNYVQHQGIDADDARALAALDLPDSLRSLILSRIDTLEEPLRRTLKVASVVGRVFSARDLPGAVPDVGDVDLVRAHLRTLGEHDLVQLDRAEDEAYAFKHVVTQEAAYESMPFALRARLHVRVGTFLEETQPDAIDRNLDLLAHHFWHGDDEERKRGYLRRAGEAAQAAYANEAAIDYLERLGPLLEGADRVQALLRLSDVLALVGSWDRAEEVATESLELAASAGDGRRAGLGRDRARRDRPQARPLRGRERAPGARHGVLRRRRPGRRGRARPAPRRHDRRPARSVRRGPRALRGEPRHPRAPRGRRRHRQPLQQPRRGGRVRRRLRRCARVQRARAGRAPVDRRSLGHLRVDVEPRDDRDVPGALGGRRRALRGGDAPEPRDRRRLDGRHRPQQPRQLGPRPRRPRSGADALRGEPGRVRGLRRSLGDGLPAGGHRRPRGRCRRRGRRPGAGRGGRPPARGDRRRTLAGARGRTGRSARACRRAAGRGVRRGGALARSVA